MSTTQAYANLHAHSIDIWVTPIEDYRDQIEQFEQTLTIEESTRAQRYRFDRDKQRFIVSRGRLRQLIEHYLSIPAHRVRFTNNPYDKPFIDQARHNNPALYFNVSHSHNMILYAFGIHPTIGVDIEYMKTDRSLDQLAKYCYTENELEYYQTANDKTETFYKLWSHKEAYLKAIGTGLSTSLKNIEINLSHHAESSITENVLFDQNLTWHAVDLRLFSHYQAALVTSTYIKDLNIIQIAHT